MEPTFTAWTKIVLRLIFSLSLLTTSFAVHSQPVQAACNTCSGGNSCFCCDDADPNCNCVAEDPGDGDTTCGTTGSLDAGRPTPVCAADVDEATAFCNNQYNPIPLNQNLIILLLAGVILGVSLLFNPRSLFA